MLLCFIALYELLSRILKRSKKKRTYFYLSNNYIKDTLQKGVNEEFLRNQHLLTKTRSTPIIGWTMKPDLNSDVVWTDKNGFRNDNIDLENRKVVAVFGGSVAQGSYASDNNHTIAGRLQHYLQKEYGEKIVVLNMAQSSFTLIQEVSLFCLLADKLDIKISIFIDGHNDVSSAFMNHPKFFGFLGPFFKGWEKSCVGMIKVDTFFKTALRFLHHFSYATKHTRRLIKYLLIKKTVTEKVCSIEQQLHGVLKSFTDMAEIVCNRLNNSGRFALMTLQPVLYEYKQPTRVEKEFLLNFSQDRILFWRLCYKNLKTNLYKRWHSFYITNKIESNVILADFTQIINQVENPVFVDDCHFADFGYDLYAQNIFHVIKTQGWINT